MNTKKQKQLITLGKGLMEEVGSIIIIIIIIIIIVIIIPCT